MTEYYKVEIGAHSQEQADEIQNALLAKRLITGGQSMHFPARFRWQGAFQDCEYWTVTSWTTVRHKEEIIATVAQVSKETVPVVCLLPMEGNNEFLAWIRQTVED